MTIALVDTAQDNTKSSTGSDVSWSFATVAGEIVLFKIGSNQGATTSTNGTPQLDGVNMTSIIRTTNDGRSDQVYRGIANPSGGNSTVTFTVTPGFGGATSLFVLQAGRWTGVDTTTPIGNTAFDTGNSQASLSEPISSATGNAVFISSTVGASSNLSGTGVTNDKTAANGGAVSCSIGHADGAATVTPSVAYNFTIAILNLIELLPAAGGTITGVSSRSLPLGGAAAGTILVQAESSRSLGLGGSSTGTVLVQVASQQPLPLSGAASAAVLVQGASDQPVPLSGAATATVLLQAITIAPLPLSGLAAATVLVQPASTQTLPLGGVAAGTVLVQSGSTQSLPLSGEAAVTILVGAASSVSLLLSGAAAAALLIQASSIVPLPLSGFIRLNDIRKWIVASLRSPAAPRAIITAAAARAVITHAAPAATVTHASPRALLTLIDEAT